MLKSVMNRRNTQGTKCNLRFDLIVMRCDHEAKVTYISLFTFLLVEKDFCQLFCFIRLFFQEDAFLAFPPYS